MRYWFLLRESFSMSLRAELAHRVNLGFAVALTLVNFGTGLGVLGVIYSQTDRLAGWSVHEGLILLGSFQIIAGTLGAFVLPSLSWFKEKVLRGELDDMLLRPVPNVVLVSVQRLSPLVISQVLLGLLLASVGTAGLQRKVAPVDVLAWLGTLLIAIAIGWAGRVLAASLAFWAPYFEPSFLYDGILQFARHPVGIYRTPFEVILTYLVPIAFLSTVPALTLGRGTEPTKILVGAAIGAAMVSAAVFAWHRGLMRYTSATS